MKQPFRSPVAIASLGIGAMLGMAMGNSCLQAQPLPNPPAVQADPVSFRDVVKKVLPAVVSIEAKSSVKKGEATVKRAPRELNEDVPEEFRKFFEEMERRKGEAPSQSPNLGFGSGFIVDAKGVVLTNYHVVEGADSIEVTLGDGRKFSSTDIKSDKRTDLAIVRLDTKGATLPFLEFGDSTSMEIGDRVLAVGAPFGLAGSVTHGIISAKGRDLNLNRYDDFLQTDAAINPGNSGGPLVNLAGQVVGINSAIKSRTGGFQGVGMAISGNFAKSVMQQLLKDGVVKRGYLGVELVRDLNAEAAAKLGLKGNGVIVARVFDNSPAAKAGLLIDDAITAIGSKSIKDVRELQRTVSTLALNQPVQLDILREGKAQKLTLTLEEEPKDFGEQKERSLKLPRDSKNTMSEKAGLEMTDLTAERAEALGFKQAGGAVILRVDADSAAANAGLTRGMVIIKVDKKPVESAVAAKEAIEASKPENGALLHVRSADGGIQLIVLKIAK